MKSMNNLSVGSVVLVGAGCGRGLLTLNGAQALANAEAVVYDDLIDEELLSLVPENAERVYVGKRSGAHSKKQPEINQILIDLASAGKRVVRLKGGDSFVFGRGGEEYLALSGAGIPCRLIPGVTSSVAVPENAGIPVTHRGIARSFTVITGHTATDTGENYEALAKLDGTLVFLMGLHDYPQITRKLIDCGKSADTPASVLSRGFSPQQKRIDGTLGTIADLSKDAATPAILVIGKVADFHMEDTIKTPLKNVRITVTGSESFTRKLQHMLREMGAYTDRLVTLRIEPKTQEIPERFDSYDWIVFTSSNGVEVFFDTIRDRDLDLRALSALKFACIGKGTADKLREHGFHADFIPERFTAKDLGAALAAAVSKDDRILILRATNGSPELSEELTAAGMTFEDRKVYDTENAVFEYGETTSDVTLKLSESDYLVFASAGGVKAFFASSDIPEGCTPVCIGKLTADELKKHTNCSYLTADTFTAEGICSAILRDRD